MTRIELSGSESTFATSCSKLRTEYPSQKASPSREPTHKKPARSRYSAVMVADGKPRSSPRRSTMRFSGSEADDDQPARIASAAGRIEHVKLAHAPRLGTRPFILRSVSLRSHGARLPTAALRGEEVRTPSAVRSEVEVARTE